MNDRPFVDRLALSRQLLEAVYGRWERWTADGGYATPAEWLAKLVESTRGELASLRELPAAARFAFEDEVVPEGPAVDVLCSGRARPILDAFDGLLRSLNRAEPAPITALFKTLRAVGRERYDMRGRDVMFQVRAALTGAVAGPCLEVVVCLLGRQRCLDRISPWRFVDGEGTAPQRDAQTEVCHDPARV